MVEDEDGDLVVYGEGTPTAAQAIHIALNDPARALRYVEAGRRILARHRDCVGGGSYQCESFDGLVCPDLADLLYRWADHLDYEPAWMPEG